MQAEVNEEQTEIEDIARRVTDNQPAEEVLYDLAELFKVFEILREYESCTHLWKVNFASEILRRFLEWDSRR